MIFDKLSNASIYYGISDRIKRALQWLHSTDLNALPAGRLEIDGDKIYANISTAETKSLDQSHLETHEKYIDIQYVHKGEEYIGILPSEFLGADIKRDSEHDVCFFEGKPDLITVREGYFMLVFPHDAHVPRITIKDPVKTSKIVVKVKWPE
ncbi:MAG: YhcH/YjgK/YiaL family protein [Treponema sp.]|jgi:YhcH/YjgK/YiaL family protein|nr:YhcH/YjgK/YiaL family protein [Treponema sp.]